MGARALARMDQIGLQPLGAGEGLAMFGRLLEGDAAHVAAMRIDWRRLAATFPPPPLWAGLTKAAQAPQLSPSRVLENLQTAAPADRLEILAEHLRGEVAHVLGWSSTEQVGPRQKLFELGLDSLTSVELRARLERSLGCSLPLTVAFDYPSVEALAGYLAQQLQLSAEEPAAPVAEGQAIDEQAERLAAMSDEEVESLMAEKFKDLLD
jgi:myxalamid-type polyketide synthase MxaB